MQESKRKLLNLLFGKKCEQIAAKYLQQKGYSILVRNFSYRGGEIDIIAKKDFKIVFIEVKGRNSSLFGNAKEAVNYKKQERIKEGAKLFMLKHNLNENEFEISFDVISIENNNIEWVENAFT
ncbi:YraN family protein [Desulfurella sp.]|uniref:YraN family protein n=1 Tax=Desulfurella sp. TaxID=1962857 RepID=UPI003D11E689